MRTVKFVSSFGVDGVNILSLIEKIVATRILMYETGNDIIPGGTFILHIFVLSRCLFENMYTYFFCLAISRPILALAIDHALMLYSQPQRVVTYFAHKL